MNCFSKTSFNSLQSGVAYIYISLKQKHHKTSVGFLMFSGGRDKQQWTVMDES